MSAISSLLAPIAEAPPWAELDPAPINPNWIREGSPQARFKFLGKSDDGASWHVVWECTEGHFDWHYDNDETVFILSGEVFISSPRMKERRVTVGDMIWFAAGSTYTWRVTKPVRKFAVFRRAIPLPLSLIARAWSKLMGGFVKADASAMGSLVGLQFLDLLKTSS